MKADLAVIEKMIQHCENAFRFSDGLTEQDLLQNAKDQYAICMAILQIGELTTRLTDEYKEKRSEIPWIKIKNVRNIIVHGYGTVDMSLLWVFLNEHMPVLYNKLKEDNCKISIQGE